MMDEVGDLQLRRRILQKWEEVRIRRNALATFRRRYKDSLEYLRLREPYLAARRDLEAFRQAKIGEIIRERMGKGVA